MGISFNLVVAPRPYAGFYRPAHPVFFAASPVFFRPAVDPRTALGIGAAAAGLSMLSHAFNSRAHPPLVNHGNPLYQNAQRIQPQQPAQPAATGAKLPEPPKVATPLADALDGAKGLKNGSDSPKAVTALQKFLQKAGYGEKLGKTGTSHDGVDGVFGNRTGSALEQFQIDNHLPKTGILDEATVKMMHEVEQKMATPKPEEAAQQRIAMQRRPSSPSMGG